MASRSDEIDDGSFREPSLIESVSPLKLIGFINDVLRSILEDPEGNIVDPSVSPNSHTPSALKICSSFASDQAPLVLFILKEQREPLSYNDPGRCEFIVAYGVNIYRCFRRKVLLPTRHETFNHRTYCRLCGPHQRPFFTRWQHSTTLSIANAYSSSS